MGSDVRRPKISTHLQLDLSSKTCCHCQYQSIASFLTRLLALQVLRTSFKPAQGSDSPKQTILPAAAITFALPSGEESEGAAALQCGASGTLSVAKGSSLQQKWLQAAHEPFDLFNEPLTRVRVRTTLPCDTTCCHAAPAIICCRQSRCRDSWW